MICLLEQLPINLAIYKFVITIDYYSFTVTSTEGATVFGSNLLETLTLLILA